MADEEQEEIAVIIDTWYLEWKGQFPQVPHPLGIAKEQLKSKLCEWAQEKQIQRVVDNERR